MNVIITCAVDKDNSRYDEKQTPVTICMPMHAIFLKHDEKFSSRVFTKYVVMSVYDAEGTVHCIEKKEYERLIRLLTKKEKKK